MLKAGETGGGEKGLASGNAAFLPASGEGMMQGQGEEGRLPTYGHNSKEQRWACEPEVPAGGCAGGALVSLLLADET